MALADQVQLLGLHVWHEEFQLDGEPRLAQRLENGLSVCRFGLLVLSPAFFLKSWSRPELEQIARLARQGRIGLVWHQVPDEAAKRHCPELARIPGIDLGTGAAKAAARVYASFGKSVASAVEARAAQVAMANDSISAETTCPHCRGTAYYRGAGNFICGECGLGFDSGQAASA